MCFLGRLVGDFEASDDDPMISTMDSDVDEDGWISCPENQIL